jgi:signal transduction histidine kinase
LNNVVRHARATTTTVDVTRVGRGLRVTVTDDGVGFDALAVPATRRGLRDCVTGRLAAIGGTATVDSLPGHGTTVRLEWTDGG